MTFDELAATKPPCALTQEQRQRPMATLFANAVLWDRQDNERLRFFDLLDLALRALTADRSQNAAVSRQEIR